MTSLYNMFNIVLQLSANNKVSVFLVFSHPRVLGIPSIQELQMCLLSQHRHEARWDLEARGILGFL